MAGPWEKYGAQPAAPQASADPIVKPADPYKAEDQQFQRNAEARAAQDQALQMQRLQMEREREQRSVQKDSLGTVDEKRVATLTARIAGAFSDINSVNQKDPTAQEPGVIESLRGGLSPTGVMGIPTRLVAGANRRTVYDAQVDALDALLTLGTGAAYNREQLEGQLAAYFPAYGDTPQEIAAKNQRLQRQIAAAKANAGPAWANVEPLIAQYLQGVPEVPDQGGEDPGITGTVTDDRPNEDPNAITVTRGGGGPNGGGGFWQGIGAGVGDLVEGGLNNTVGLVTNPVSSLIGRSMGYEGYTGDIGQTVRDALQLPEGNQTAAAINQAAAGGFSGAGMARGLGGIVGSNALLQYGSTPILDTITGATAAGSGEIAKQMGAGPGGQALATLAGGFAPSAVSGLRNVARGGGGAPPRGPAPDMDVVRAGERQGVPIRQPDARPELRGDFANLQTSQYAGPAINQARTADNAIIERRVQEIGGQGNASDPYALGQRVQAAGRRYIANTKEQADRLYKRAKDLSAGGASAPAAPANPTTQVSIPPSRGGWVIRDKETGNAVMETFDESVASKVNTARYEVVPSRQHLEQFNAAVKENGGQPPEGWNKAFGGAEAPSAAPQAVNQPKPGTYGAPNADAVLEANIQELRAAGENSNAAAIKYLEGLRADLRGGLSIDSMLNLRSNMRGQLSERGLTGTDTDRRVRQVIDAMNTDLAEQLPAEASAALKAADDFYRQRQEFINGTLKQFMGDRGNPLPAETAASRLVSMAQGKGNFDRFSKMWGQLDDGERADVAATIAASLGRKQNGDFSPATLIKSLDPRQGINPRTARLVFGEDGAKALNDLRVIAQAKTDTANALNSSKTGVMVNRSASGLRTLILGGLGFSASGPVGAVAAPMAEGLIAKIGQERAARLMLNPDFTKWLRAMPEATNPKAINAYFDKLKASGAKSQIVANDIDGFTNAVMEAFAQSPRRAAAQEEDN